jgi:CDP-diacylglycerol--glycerol-3-phosphate 3-phosphatidyltransferase
VDAVAAPVSAWNLPNALTVLRLLLVPVFVWLLLRESGEDAASRVAAVVLFVGAMITDLVDGRVARARGIVTPFGTIMDPIADKALVGSALIGLSVLGEVPWWATVVILTREVGVTVLRFAVIRYGIMPAGRGGKTKTLLQTVTLVLLMLPLPDTWSWLTTGLLYATVLVTVVTGVDYVADAVRLKRTSTEEAARQAADGPAGGAAGAVDPAG